MELFWLDDPDILFQKYNQMIPQKNQSVSQQLNSLTRLILFITLILLIIKFDLWYIFLIFALIVILILSLTILDNTENYKYFEQKLPEKNVKKPNDKNKKDEFSFTKKHIEKNITRPIKKITQQKNNQITKKIKPLNYYNSKKQEKLFEKEKYISNKMENSTPLNFEEPLTTPVFVSTEVNLSKNMARKGLTTDFKIQQENTKTTRITLPNPKSRNGLNAAFEPARHNGSSGYLNADTSNISSIANLDNAKEFAINDYNERENMRRENIMNQYMHKKEKERKYYLESSGYEPPYIQNRHYYRDDISSQRTYNGYAIL